MAAVTVVQLILRKLECTIPSRKVVRSIETKTDKFMFHIERLLPAKELVA